MTAADVVDLDSVLRCWRTSGRMTMRQAHRHDDIEFHSCDDAPLTYMYAGKEVTLPPGTVSAFWGTLPHQLLNQPPWMDQMTVPLSVLLSWRLPQLFVASLLHGEVLVGRPGNSGPDGAPFLGWAADLESGDAELRAIVLLEIEASVRRFARDCSPAVKSPGVHRNDKHLQRTSIMASFIATHLSEPIYAEDVTRAANLSVHYGMTIFRETMGMTITNYLANCRVATAQRLLITTDHPAHEIAFEAGFGSLPQFYTRFTAACGQSPGAYRRAMLAHHTSL